MSVTRFGISLEEELLDAFDDYVYENKFPNRSQAVRQLIERNIVEKKWKCDNEVAGAVILIYDPGKKEVALKSMEIQHDYLRNILSSQHFHLSEKTSMEVIALKGPAHTLTELSDQLIGIKGIKHGKLTMSKAD